MPLGQATSDMKGHMLVSTLTATNKGATRGIYNIRCMGTWWYSDVHQEGSLYTFVVCIILDSSISIYQGSRDCQLASLRLYHHTNPLESAS